MHASLYRLPLFLLLFALATAHAQSSSVTVACDPAALVAAITAANSNGAADTITLAPACVYTFTAAHETTNDDGNSVGNALPSIRNDAPNLDLTIVGNGATLRRAPDAPDFRLLRVDNQAELALSDLTIENGRASQGGAIALKFRAAGLTVERATFRNNTATATNGEYGGGAIFVHESALTVRDSSFINNQAAPRPASSNSTGGALRILLSDLTVARSTFSDNQASFGGAIYIDGGLRDSAEQPIGTALLITDSTLRNNTAFGDGGGIYRCLYGAGQPLIIERSLIQANQAGPTGQGGGVVANCTGVLTITQSTIADNTTGSGGGGLVVDKVAATITNSTIAGNQATNENSYGGGVWSYEASVRLVNSTVAGNSADFGAGMASSTGSTGSLRNTIFSNTATNPYNTRWNCMGPLLQDEGGNLEHPGTPNNEFDRDCTSAMRHGDPKLLPLADNGGPVLTMALQSGSPAINAGSNCPATDQRNFPRVGACDLGAYEFGATAPNGTPTPGPIPTPNPALTKRLYLPLLKQ